MKKFLFLSLFLVVLAGCGKNVEKNVENKQVDETKKDSSIKEEISENSQIIVPDDWKTYKNEKYGFEIKIPSNWQVSEEKKNCFNNNMKEVEVDMRYLIFSAQFNNKNFSFLKIAVSPIQNIDLIDKTPLCNKGEIIGIKNNFNFGYISGSIEYNDPKSEYKEFISNEEKNRDLVLKTFSFIEESFKKLNEEISPEKVVSNFYDNYIIGLNKNPKNTDRLINSNVFTDKVINNSKIGRMYDPFLCVQDYPNSTSKYYTELLNEDSDSSEVLVKILDWDPITVNLIKSENGSWKIDNILCKESGNI